MIKISLETLDLVTFDKNNKEHLMFFKNILSDRTITKRFTGFLPRLNADTKESVVGKGFFVQTKII